MGKKLETYNLYEKGIEDLIISADKVAHVQLNNPLEHAMLILIKSGYSSIPVLDSEFKLQGLISQPLILDSILGIERIEFEKLGQYVVKDVMNREIPFINENEGFFKALKLAIDNPFLCVVDDAHTFKGILTRRTLLKFVNRYLHETSKESVGPS
ncbi:cyclic-di-AMP-binding protein CbpB [Pseudalkalibacillus caeni]|uniref:CBS domain-containing protein n=1 Tax=Exobacillus caeni TaxID=2574798 RepID=A0A5R9F5F7_9BACL|nr:cyclic-di-AMP-binding protein CbpB [Pseudalkalibacillus caeni]TLS37719.1 CBS domain-containing protein [Pseudalkalibacillus caeni]